MNCKFHGDEKGNNTCNLCGCWLCEKCALDIDGRIYCKSCLKNKLNKVDGESSKSTLKTVPNDFLTLVFSVIPGCGQMYLGYYKRGLLILLAFIALSFFGPIVLVSFIFSFFDTFRIKRNITRGIYLEDNISDLKDFVKENKWVLIVLFGMMTLPSLYYKFLRIIRYIDSFFGINLILAIFGFFIITGLIVILLIVKSNDKKVDLDEKDNIIDATENENNNNNKKI